MLPRARDGAWLRYVYTDEIKKKPAQKEEGEQAGSASGEPIISSSEKKEKEEIQYEEEVKEYMMNERMLERGYAIPLLSKEMKYYDRMASAARYSNATKKGLWGACEIEKKENGLLKAQEVDDCVIKGSDLGEGQKIYRAKGCLGYVNTVVIQSHGDRWLCDEEEAEENGWAKAPDCY